ncbi:MAG: glycerophosphodiester phosphodiesterase [Mariniblastus sp.]
MKKVITRSAWAIMLTTLALAAVVGFWRPGLLRGQNNDGHQLGGDLMQDLSGNTIECFEKGIEEYESNDNWLYSECDIRDTKDGQLIVFHDWDISSVPNSAENQSAIGGPVNGQAICDLTLNQVRGLTLKCGCKIPTLEEVLAKAAELKLKKPLLLEVKYLHSDVGREKLLELAVRYRDAYEIEIHFLAFIRNIHRSFPNSEFWLKKFSQAKFRVYQVFRPKTAEYDLCETLN